MFKVPPFSIFFCNITGLPLLQVGCLPCFGSANYNIISRSSKFIKNELHYKSFKGFCQDCQTTLFSRTSLYCFFWISGFFDGAKRSEQWCHYFFESEIYHCVESNYFLRKYQVLTSSKTRRLHWMYLTFCRKRFLV